MKPQLITLNSEVFDEFRMSIDVMLQMLLSQMKQKDLTEGTLTAKIKVVVKQRANEDGEFETNLVFEPDVSTKLGAKGKMECGTRGALAIKLDENGMPIVASNQIDIDELLREKEGA